MKRFTDTDKWRDSFFQALKPEFKLALIYLYDNCDNAGVFDPNLLLADFCIGAHVDWDAFRAAMGDRLDVIESGKWYLTKFVEFQYGKLSADSKPHQHVMRLLQNHRVSKGYPKGIHTLKDKDKDKDQEKDRDKDAAEIVWKHYPKKAGRLAAIPEIKKAIAAHGFERIRERTEAYAAAVALWPKDQQVYVPDGVRWFKRGSYDDDPSTWVRGQQVFEEPAVRKVSAA